MDKCYIHKGYKISLTLSCRAPLSATKMKMKDCMMAISCQVYIQIYFEKDWIIEIRWEKIRQVELSSNPLDVRVYSDKI